MATRPLPRAPTDAIGPGGPRLGRFAGWLGRADLSSLTPPGLLASVRHALRERRWQRAFLVGPGHTAVLHLGDGGALATGLLWLVERPGGRVLLERAAAGLPGVSGRVGERPGAGARASFAAPGLELLLERRSDRFQASAEAGAVRLSATLDTRGAPEPQALVALLGEDGLRAAQVSGPLALGGWLELDGVRQRLEGGLAALDFTSGVFPAAVAWRRLTALAPPGEVPRLLHLAEGPLVGCAPQPGPAGGELGQGERGRLAGESVLLGPGGPTPLPPLTLQRLDEPLTWRARSRDGAVELTFRPGAEHRERKELLVRSALQTFLLGTLSGHLTAGGGDRLEVRDWPAMAEDFSARG